jgi:DNA modification methylase
MLDGQAPDVGAVAPVTGTEPSTPSPNGIYNARGRVPGAFHDDTGGASRFLYVAKAPRSERDAGLPPTMVNDHPTVKPIDVMRWLTRLVTPPNGRVFDPFVGSGSTGCACALEGFSFTGGDLSARHIEIAGYRIAYWQRMAAKALLERAERERAVPLDLFDCL